MEDSAFKMLSMMLSTQCVQRTVELYIFRSSLLPSPVVSIDSDIKESTVLLWECLCTHVYVCMYVFACICAGSCVQVTEQPQLSVLAFPVL